MSYKNFLLVTFPVDLGNRTIETNFHSIFKNDMDFYRFAEEHAYSIDNGRVSKAQSMKFRVNSAFALRQIVSDYNKQGKTILFNGLSPALFSYGKWSNKNTAIALDWTRTLYPYVLGKPIIKDAAFYLHKQILKNCSKIFYCTDALFNNLVDIYGVKISSLYKVPIPFMIENLDIPPRPTPFKPKVLFVGGDLKRKGGDILLKSWNKDLKDKAFLSMMTNDPSANLDGINFLPNIKYGSEAHKETFKMHDILILPTTIDSYPQVLGEAAAAGLAVISTKFALASQEVITDGETGFITNSPEDAIFKLGQLLKEPQLIDKFKKQGYEHMKNRFSKEVIRNSYLDVLRN